MTITTTTVTAKDGRQIQVKYWSSSTARATVQLCHGMAEHIDRYEEFAQFLHKQDYNVIGHNHRGHGENEVLGHYADKDGWLKTISDIKEVQDFITKDSKLPLYLFAHSMGSFIAQGFAMRHGDRLSGLIISGTNYQNPLIYHAGRFVAKVENFRLGLGVPSQTMDKLSFASFNSHFKPTRTDFDWLSRNPEQVDRYIADPLCGFACSSETWQQLLSGMIEISKSENLSKIPKHLPIYIMGGDQDPVGRMGKGIPALAKKLRLTGHDKVTTKLYKNGRHEMLNETCKTQVYLDISEWIEKN
ncbi:MAG: alpha-beta hydrolase superfamily lysophospholipase [Glaciecola sp.]|jgi:alpha-beta hydrolase superfamily lysophospholipase